MSDVLLTRAFGSSLIRIIHNKVLELLTQHTESELLSAYISANRPQVIMSRSMTKVSRSPSLSIPSCIRSGSLMSYTAQPSTCSSAKLRVNSPSWIVRSQRPTSPIGVSILRQQSFDCRRSEGFNGSAKIVLWKKCWQLLITLTFLRDMHSKSTPQSFSGTQPFCKWTSLSQILVFYFLSHTAGSYHKLI